MSRCVVFGGEGFVGVHLVKRLHREGHEVTVFSRDERVHFASDIRRIRGDFMNRVDVDRAIEGQEYVFNLITSTNPAISDIDPYIDIEANVLPTIRLLESCVTHKVARVIFPSSGGAIYGDNPKSLIGEDDAAFPISPYAIGKQSIEGYLRFFKHKYELDYLALRISNIYGPGQHTSGKKHGVVSVFLENVLNDQPIKIFGDGSMVRDYIYINDLVDIVVKMAFSDTRYDTYNVGSGVGVSVNDIVDAIEDTLQRRVVKNHYSTPSTYVDKIVLDCRRSVEEFGEYSRISITEGVDLTRRSMQR